MMKELSSALVLRELHASNLDIIVQARSKAIAILKRVGNNVNLDTNEGKLESVYDHSNCHDCGCGSSLAFDCNEHFEELSAKFLILSKKLASLIEVREKMKDMWQLLNNTSTPS